jgi:hypothetical protein
MATKARRRDKKGTVGLPVLVFLVCVVSWREVVIGAQTLTQRGFVESSIRLFPQEARNDPTQVVGDLLARDEVFFKPASWIQFAGGLELRANSHEEVEDSWRLDVDDRGRQRPHASLRRLSATLTDRAFTLDVGKQFIRWGKADIVNPTDRFAPRDFLNVVDADFIAVWGVRGVLQAGSETVEAVWVPRFTPSRVPLIDQRWTVVPPEAAAIPIADAGATWPTGSQAGVRWGHLGAGIEYSLSFFDGFNHLPNIDSNLRPAPPGIQLTRTFPAIRTYGADAAIPTRWFTIKGEAAYLTSPSAFTDEYVLYVVQLERQTGEWVIVGGYAGEAVTARRSALAFAPDRGMAKSIVARASYTLDGNRSLAMETAVRQNGDGLYARAQYSQARGQHWRATLTGVAIAGHSDDFLGQYHRNSHVAFTLRYSF